MQSPILLRVAALLLGLASCFPQIAAATGETEYVLEKVFTSVTPVFMAGHEGDPNWIQGYAFEGDILLDGQRIGSVSGATTLWYPPLQFNDVYNEVGMTAVNTIDGIGTLDVYGQAVVLTSGTTATTGDVVLAWTGSVTNGSGALANAYGLAAGNAIANMFTSSGNGTEILRIRFGY